MKRDTGLPPTLALSLYALAASSCINVGVQELQNFDAFSAMTPDSEDPKVFWAESAPITALPATVPYAVLTATTGDAVNLDSMAREIGKHARELNADIVIIYDQGSHYAGSVNQYIGFGIATSRPVYNRVLEGICLRRSPFRVGYTVNENDMVLTCGEEARACGLQEGDTLLSINGLPISSGGASRTRPSSALALDTRPGDELTLVWIRPGQGRMEGTMTALENPPTQLDLESSVSLAPPKPEASASFSAWPGGP